MISESIFSVYNLQEKEEVDIIEKIKESEYQIETGNVIDASVVFEELRAKYGY